MPGTVLCPSPNISLNPYNNPMRKLRLREVDPLAQVTHPAKCRQSLHKQLRGEHAVDKTHGWNSVCRPPAGTQ